ncbi:nucleotidyltransferase family protein [Croceiramulus getboli]|nr:nucleotidyltransferase family protein [Flavobacteriaceae bacterium YJPT1-3]
MSKVPILLLAAGGSRRMKTSKPLLEWEQVTLLEHQIRTLKQTGCAVHVVLGAFAKAIQSTINAESVTIHYFEDWEQGMGASIAFGLRKLHSLYPKMEGVLIALVDQPLLNTADYQKLLDAFRPGQQQIILSRSEDQISGPPVLFDATYFEVLSQLTGDEGARAVIPQHREHVVYIDQGARMQDMDTPERYRQLRKP